MIVSIICPCISLTIAKIFNYNKENMALLLNKIYQGEVYNNLPNFILEMNLF